MHATDNQRCSETHYHKGLPLQCEGHRGHASVHYNGEVWWKNDTGFPDHLPKSKAEKFWLGLALTGAIIFLTFIVWLIRG